MGAQILPPEGDETTWGVRCWESPDHAMHIIVETQAHATNLAAKHDREHHADTLAEATGITHPERLHLAAAAGYLMVCHADRLDGPTSSHAYASYSAALDMWEALVGLAGDDALAYARAIRDTNTAAAVLPF